MNNSSNVSSSSSSSSQSLGRNNNNNNNPSAITEDDDFVGDLFSEILAPSPVIAHKAVNNSNGRLLLPKAHTVISNKTADAASDSQSIGDDDWDFDFIPYAVEPSSFNAAPYKVEHNSNELSPLPKALEVINGKTVDEASDSESTESTPAPRAEIQLAQVQALVNQPFEITPDIIRLVSNPVYNPHDLQPDDIASLNQDLHAIFDDLRALCQNCRHLTPNDLTAIERLLTRLIERNRAVIAGLGDNEHLERRVYRNFNNSDIINIIPRLINEIKTRGLTNDAETAAPIIHAFSEFKQTLLPWAFANLPNHGDFADICDQTLQYQNDYRRYINTDNIFLNVLKPLYLNIFDPFMKLCDEIVGNKKDQVLRAILEPVNPEAYAQWEPPRLLPDHCSLEQGLDFIKMTRALREVPGSAIGFDLTTQLGLDDTVARFAYNRNDQIPLSNQQLQEIAVAFHQQFSQSVVGDFRLSVENRDVTEILLDTLTRIVISRLGCEEPADLTALRRMIRATCFTERYPNRLTMEGARFLLSEYFFRAQARQNPPVAKRALPQWKRDLYLTQN